MLRKRHLPSYPDGVLEVYEAKVLNTGFGARRNIERLDDMRQLGTMCYQAQSLREQDQEFASRESFTLSLKVRCPRVESVKSNQLVVIGKTLYDIGHIDRTSREMYLYLTEVRTLDDAE